MTIERLRAEPYLAVDTETSGLYPFLGDAPFLIVYGTDKWQAHLWAEEITDEFREALSNHPRVIGHNLKFDMHMLAQVGIELKGALYDTISMARLCDNQRLSYSMDALAPDVGKIKSKAAEEYIAAHKLTVVFDKGGKPTKKKCYDLIPRGLILPYAKTDVEITYCLFKKYSDEIVRLSRHSICGKSLYDLFKSEQRVLRVVYNLEKRGVKLDLKYLKDASKFYSEKVRSLEKIITTFAPGFVNSARFLKPFLLNTYGVNLPLTKKGSPKTDEETLLDVISDHPHTKEFLELVLEYRDAHKILNTYIDPYAFFAGKDGVLHFSLNPSGTHTGRFSSNDPNVQNVPKKAVGPYPIKGAFVPRESFRFVEIDYKAQEFRLALHFSKDRTLGARVQGGEDPHQATADLTGLSRHTAKTVTFATLYGAGPRRIATQLGVSLEEGKSFLDTYLTRLPRFRALKYAAQERALNRGYLQNPYGRILRFNKDTTYKAPNHLIQSTGSDICKAALVDLFEYLKDKKSKMVLQVHDSILFEVHESELVIIPKLVNIMRSNSVFESDVCSMDCSVEWSMESWASMKSWESFERETRNHFQEKAPEANKDNVFNVGGESATSNDQWNSGYTTLL